MDRAWAAAKVSLNGLSRRLEATAQNLANINTPTYARREVTFEDQLSRLLHGPDKLPLVTTDPRHISMLPQSVEAVRPVEEGAVGELVRWDGNGVDIDIEMAKLAETRMHYQALFRLLARKAASYRTAIGGGA